MISYLGVTLDELVQTFESCFSFSDDRIDRLHEEPYHLEEIIVDEAMDAPGEALDASDLDAADDEELDEDDGEDFEDDDDFVDVFVDDEGRLHSLGESLPFAAEAVIGFLTDYIIADDIDEEWLSLDHARGALLALRICLPTLEEVPFVNCAYSFLIARDPESGLPTFVTMKSLSGEAIVPDSLVRTDKSYIGVVTDDSDFEALFDAAGIPEDERFPLGDAISEAAFDLADEQCGIQFDVVSFCKKIGELAATQTARKVLEGLQGLDSTVKH